MHGEEAKSSGRARQSRYRGASALEQVSLRTQDRTRMASTAKWWIDDKGRACRCFALSRSQGAGTHRAPAAVAEAHTPKGASVGLVSRPPAPPASAPDDRHNYPSCGSRAIPSTRSTDRRNTVSTDTVQQLCHSSNLQLQKSAPCTDIWYTRVTCTNFVQQISTMVLILCTKVQKFEIFNENTTVGPFPAVT